MKLRVLFLKRKQIYYFLFVIIVFLFFGISFVLNNRSSYTTFNVGMEAKSYKQDLTGDGKQDTLYITLNKDKYYLQVNTEKDSIYLDPGKNIPTLGNYYNHWPMRVKILDISRDKIPEIFVQSSQNNKPIQHVFIYKNNSFKDVFSSYNNVLGFIDCSNNKTPKMISGKISQGDFNFSNYILIQDKLQRYEYKTDEHFMGKNTISHLLGVITTFNSEKLQPAWEAFDPATYNNSLAVLSNLSTLASNFIFQDATFIDTKSNKDGMPIQVEWILNFRGNPDQSNTELKNHTLKVNLKAYENSNDSYYYKISYISIQK